MLKSLCRRFPPPEWVVACEFSPRAGFAERRVDAMFMNVWPSRGLRVIGIEIKGARGDWLNELRQPAKAEMAMRYCDAWYLAAEAGVAKADEIPPPWGWLERKGGRLFERKAAPKLDPIPLDKRFVASFLRAAVQQAPAVRVLREARAEARNCGFRDGREYAERAITRERDRLTAELAAVKKITDAAAEFGWDWQHLIGELRRYAACRRMDADRSRLVAAARSAIAAGEASLQAIGETEARP